MVRKQKAIKASEVSEVSDNSVAESSTPVSTKEKKQTNLAEKAIIMEQLEDLVHRRGIAKGKVTKILNVLYPDEKVAPLAQAQVIVYRKKLEAASVEYNAIHDKILALVPVDEREAHDQHTDAFEDLCDEASIMLESRAEELRQPSVSNSNTGYPAPVIIHQPLKMPIPSFDGLYENWPKFKAMFKDLVDKSPDPPAVKLYHLDKALIGSAAGLIDAKTINEGNYAHAWEILEERYENKRHTIETHIHGLLHMKRMSKESHIELRSLVEECSKHVESLNFLGQKLLGVSELIVVHLLTTGLDRETRRRWENTIQHGDLPSYSDTLKFLKEQCFIMERCEASSSKQVEKPVKMAMKYSSIKAITAASATEAHLLCEFCAKNHPNFQCPEFKVLSIQQRLAKVREKNVCFNCLRKGHRSKDCPSTKVCIKCKRRHHSLLHAETKSFDEDNTNETSPQSREVKPPLSSHVTSSTCSTNLKIKQQVLLLTAIVNVMDKNYHPYPARVLLDSGSQVNLITRELANIIGVQQYPSHITVAGVNNTRSHASGCLTAQIRSMYSDFRANIDYLITDNVTSHIPTSNVNISTWEFPSGIHLADPTFHQSSKVDMLIGSEWFLRLLLPGEICVGDNIPVLRETKLGWVVGGVIDGKAEDSVVHSHSVTLQELSKSIERFWEVENISNEGACHPSTEEEECEAHFQEIHRRDSSGRYMVQ